MPTGCPQWSAGRGISSRVPCPTRLLLTSTGCRHFWPWPATPQIKDELLKGYKVANMTYRVHLDGDNLLPYLTGQTEKGPRESFFYINDDQQLVALRFDNWKLVFMEQQVPGTLLIWANPFTSLRVPKMFNLRMDPYERADVTSNTYWDWEINHVYLLVPAQAYVGQFLATFKDYPQRQKSASFNLDEVLKGLQEGQGAK